MKTVKSKSNYSARGFSLEPGEDLSCSFEEFSRDGRSPMLVPVIAGEELPAITTAHEGKIYVRKEKGGTEYAVMLVPESWE